MKAYRVTPLGGLDTRFDMVLILVVRDVVEI
jgi:hypothetical protein